MSSLRSFILTGMIIVALLAVAGCTQQQPADTCSPESGSAGCAITPVAASSKVTTSSQPAATETWQKVRLETSKGNIVIALDPEMPITTGNFEKLVKQGYYDGVIFHRVIDGFMIQGGDPTGTGRGGPGYMIKDEFTSHNKNNRGTIAMANSGPNTGGSQFFINSVNNNYLDTKHPVFGNVVEGMDVVDAIGKVQTTGLNAGSRPLQNVTIIRAVMI